MNLFDTLTLDATPRQTRDGYVQATVRVARTGVQEYLAAELQRDGMFADRAPTDRIRVYRPAEHVFDDDAMRSFAYRPVTIDHPAEAVTADNWKQYAVGFTGNEIDARDGKFITVPMALMDSSAVRAVMDGKRQLSMGYTCDLKAETGTTPDGLSYDAIQTNIRANHLAVVSAARGGPELRIGDNAVPTKTITFDGLPLEVTDAAEAAINKLLAKLGLADAAKVTADTQIGTLTAQVSTKDGEIVALKAQLADAAMTPAKLDAAVAARAKVLDAAKRILPTLDAAGKTDGEIKRMAVAAKIGDAAATMNDDAVNGAFSALTVSTADANTSDPLRAAIISQPTLTDAAGKVDAAFTKRNQDMANAWKQ